MNFEKKKNKDDWKDEERLADWEEQKKYFHRDALHRVAAQRPKQNQWLQCSGVCFRSLVKKWGHIMLSKVL